jgi:serine/threonine protein kinase
MNSNVDDYDCRHTNHSAVADTHDASALTSASSTQGSDAASVCERDSQRLASTPYTTGYTITALRHHPPAPFGSCQSTPSPARHPDPTAVTQGELCTSRQPLEGYTEYEHEKNLTINSLIRTGVGRGPQLVVVDHQMVAKIYDPLFYDPYEYEDAMWYADRAYSREAAAYEQLQKSNDVSDIVPAFHGAWTFDVNTTVVREGVSSEKTRSVRMILIEYLKGHCMVDVDAYSISEPIRTSILKQCLEAYIRVSHAGVNHGDLSPRNIMILGLSSNSPDVRVKLIDFDVTSVYDHPNYEFPEMVEERKEWARKWGPKLSSPIVRFFQRIEDFSCEGWCPCEDDGADQWLWQNYAEDDRYATVQWNYNERFASTTYVNPGAKIEEPVSNGI